MIGDHIEIRHKYLKIARKVLHHMQDFLKPDIKNAITVSGESGSGKSTLAYALKILLESEGIKSDILHMDDYFRLPPKTNHQARVDDIKNVGPSEVNLSLLSDHIAAFKNNEASVVKPIVNYPENQINTEIFDFKSIEILIVEGTYTGILENIDCKIFIAKNYQDTYKSRVKRARDPIIPFNEEVLKIEHKFIWPTKNQANLIVKKKNQVIKRQP